MGNVKKEARECQTQARASVFHVMKTQPTPWTALLWFQGPESEQRQLLARLRAQWPGAIEVIEPDEDGDTWGARCAMDADWLYRNPELTADVSVDGIDTRSFAEFGEFLARVAEAERSSK
jgi:hypothetical protein